MPKKKIRKLKKNITKVLLARRKELLLLLTVAFLISLSLGIYLINRPKPNGDIILQSTGSESIFTNKNPEFNVEFGKRGEPHEQWVRFEAKGSAKNPFKEEEENVWNKILNAVKPKKSLGVEMSLSGVELSQIENISDEQKVEKLKSVAEVLGTDTVETNTELVDLGRTIWNGEEEDVSRKTIVNRDVVKGVDLIYQIIDGVGLKEEIVIKNLEEYTSECGEDVNDCAIPLNEFVFDLKLDEGVTLKKGWYNIENSSTETYYFEDEKGNYIAHFLPSFAIDGGGEKTSNVKMDVEEVGEREYKIKVIVDIEWLLSEDRVFPVRIDPSIVHNSESNFDTGIYNGIEYSNTVGGMELLGVDRVGVDSNTVGYWSFDKDVRDESGNGNNMITTLYGIQYGIQDSSLTFILNQYNGVSNPGEIDITCPYGDTNCFIYDMAGNRLQTPTINSGIAVTDGETGSGYIMYSPSLSAQGITSTQGSKHTDHFIAVKYTGSTWQYNNNSVWVNFTPTSNNILVAEITFFTSINVLDIWPGHTEGRMNDGYEFDGVDDYVKTGSLSGLSTGTPVHTIEAWIKPGEFDSLGRRQWPLLLGDASDGNIHWTYNREGTIGVGVWGAAQCGIPVTMNEWSYISVSYDGTTFRCYKNGEFFGNAIGDTSLLNLTSTVLTLGKKAISGEAYFNGSIDEVKISKVARSAEEIYRSYLQSKEKFSGEYVSSVFDSDANVSSASVSGIVSGISTGNGEIPYSTTGLVAQWNFNETSGTVANSGGSCGSTCNGTLTNFADTSGQDKVVSSGWTYNNRRWGNGALMFDGTNDSVLVPNNSSIAIEGAISIEAWIRPSKYSVNDYNHIVDKDGNYSLSIYNGKLGFYVGNPTGWWYPDVPIPLNEWSHVVVSFVGGNRRMYVNGVMVAEMSDPYTIFVNNSATFSIGSRQNGTLKYWGTIDTVRVYNRALSASEVSSNYNSNSVKYFVRGGHSADSNDGTWSEWNDSTNMESTVKSFDNKYLYDEKENGLVSYWTMDEDNGNTVVDARGINNGTATGTTVVDGKYGKGRSFNGTSSSYITVPNNSSLDPSSITIAAWIKPNAFNLGNYINKGNNSGYRARVGLGGEIQFLDRGATNFLSTPSGSLVLGNWYHVVITGGSQGLAIYINGTLSASNTVAYGGPSTTNALVFGYFENPGTEPYDGLVDEVKIYNTVLSSEKILYDYLEGIEKRGSVTLSSSALSAEESNTIKDGLVSYWNMDETSGTSVKDSMGMSNGIATGTTIEDGRVNKGRSFDGVDDYVGISNNIDLKNKSFVVSAWVKRNRNGTAEHFFGQGASTVANSSLHIGFRISNAFVCGFWDNDLETTTTYPEIGEWHYYACSYDASNKLRVLYRDGIQVASGIANANYQGIGVSVIGGASTGATPSHFISGSIDEVKIYNRALSSEEIFDEYTLTKGTFDQKDDGLISYWNMDEESGSVVEDKVGINDGTATGTTIVDGKVNKGRSFDGTDDYITLPSGFGDFTKGLTISLWANPTTNSDFARFVDFGESSGSTHSNIVLDRFSTSNDLVLSIGNGSTDLFTIATNGIINNEWHLYTATVSESGVGRIYRDGVLLSEGQLAVPANVSRTYNYIGKGNYSAAALYQGYMDEVKIYNIAKTKDEIQRMYNEGLEYRSNRVGSTVNDGLISYWNMDEESGSVVEDKVGINDGTATGTTIVDGKVNKGRSFDGTDDYITLPSGFSDFTKGLTISLWANPTSSANFARFIDFGEPSGSTYTNIVLYRQSTTNVLRLQVGNGSSPYSEIYVPNAIINNEWHLYTATVSESGMGRIYRDGILLGEAQSIVPANVSRTYNYIGKSNYPADSAYQGYMDEIKIYNRALSSEEIFDEYALSKGTFDRKNDGLISYWNMDETSGTSVKDSIGINNGIATGTTIVNGKVNNGRSFDGVDDYVGISNNIDLKDKSFVVSAWVKRNRNGTAEYFFGQGASTVSNSSLFIGFRASGAFVCGFWNNDLETTTTYPEIGEWHYYACTYDASTKLRVLYRDGIQVTSGTASANYQGVGVSVIGGVSSGATPSQFMSGSIDEVKIFNRVLSSAEIAEEYIEGVDRHSTSQSSYVNYQIQQSNISNKISLPVYIAGDEPGEYISTTIGESAYANYQQDANTVGLWHLDEIDGNGPFIQDSSVNGNNGMLVGNIHTSNGKIGGAGYFDGTSYVSLGNPPELQITGSETIDMWIYPMSFSYRMNPLDKAHGGEGAITQEPDGTVTYYYGTCGGNCNPYEYIYSYSVLQLRKWNHIAIVRDLVNMKVSIYINGVLGNSQTVSMSAATTSQLPVYIGKGYAGPYIGNIDEVRISNIVRTPEEIRQAYEVGLRTHNIEIEFGAKLDNSNLITSSSDKSFSINGITKGMEKMGSNIYAGEKIIVREQKDTGEYIAQGIVTSIDEDTGAVTVSSWDTASTFPSTGFSSNADVFKWQKEYIPVKGRTLDTQLDQAKLLTLRVDNAYGGRNVWIDNLTSDEYVTPSPQDIIDLGNSYRFFQYKAVLMSTDSDTSPIISQIQLDYTVIPPMERIMRHGKWFLSGTKQPFWWAK